MDESRWSCNLAAFQLSLVTVRGINIPLPARSFGVAAAALLISTSLLMLQLSLYIEAREVLASFWRPLRLYTPSRSFLAP